MKTKVVFLTCLVALLFSNVSMAETIKYSCGSEYGSKVTLTVQSAAKSAFYEYKGEFRAPGEDSTTGIFKRTKKFNLVGSVENYDDGSDYFLLSDKDDSYHHVLADKGKKGDTVKVIEHWVTLGNAGNKDRDCEVVSVSSKKKKKK